jgi:hypothetical protein
MRDKGIRRLVVERNHEKVGIITESNIVRVDPELHFLIRERSNGINTIHSGQGNRSHRSTPSRHEMTTVLIGFSAGYRQTFPEYQSTNRARRSTSNRDGTPEHPIIEHMFF